MTLHVWWRMLQMNKLCKKYPYLMRPLIFILLFSGIGTLIIIIATIIEYNYDVKQAHREFFRYSVFGSIDE